MSESCRITGAAAFCIDKWIKYGYNMDKSYEEIYRYDDSGDAGTETGTRLFLCKDRRTFRRSVGTVQKVLGGITRMPRYDTLEALERVLGADPGMVRDSAVLYGTKSQGKYTIDDLDQFPENIRVELIDGVSIC